MFDAEVPSELRIVVGSRGGKRIAFFNCEGTKTSEVLVSGATKDQVILVLTSMRRPELIAETAKESKDNLQHLLSTTAGRLLDRSFPLIKPLERVRHSYYKHNLVFVRFICYFDFAAIEMLLRPWMQAGTSCQGKPGILQSVPQ